jgi:hypothetical protein
MVSMTGGLDLGGTDGVDTCIGVNNGCILVSAAFTSGLSICSLVLQRLHGRDQLLLSCDLGFA